MSKPKLMGKVVQVDNPPGGTVYHFKTQNHLIVKWYNNSAGGPPVRGRILERGDYVEGLCLKWYEGLLIPDYRKCTGKWEYDLCLVAGTLKQCNRTEYNSLESYPDE